MATRKRTARKRTRKPAAKQNPANLAALARKVGKKTTRLAGKIKAKLFQHRGKTYLKIWK